MVVHSGFCSQNFVEPIEKPSATSNHFPNCSLPCEPLEEVLGQLLVLQYFMTACAKAVW